MEVYVFPLVNITLFPFTTKPLNIFEPRYLEMIHASIENNVPVALAFIDENQYPAAIEVGKPLAFVRPIAGYGHPRIIETRENGTLLVFIQGLGKVRLGPVKQNDKPYVISEAEPIVESFHVRNSLENKLSHLHQVVIRWVNQHIPEPLERDVFLKSINTPEEIVGAFSAYMVKDYDLQQVVLEMDDINERIEILHRLVESNEITP